MTGPAPRNGARQGHHRRLAAAGAMLMLAIACVEPDVEPTTEPQGEQDPVEAEILDPTTDELRDALAALEQTLTDARAALDVAAESGDVGPIAQALDLLLKDPDDDQDGPGLLPVRTLERELAGREVDQLSMTVSLARDAGGELGRAAVETLRDAIAGDLGAWERDAEGVVASARAAATGQVDLDEATTAIRELPGEGTRALAWVFLAESTGDASLRAAAAERGAGHLGVALFSVQALTDPSSEPDVADDDTAAEPDTAAAPGTAPGPDTAAAPGTAPEPDTAAAPGTAPEPDAAAPDARAQPLTETDA